MKKIVILWMIFSIKSLSSFSPSAMYSSLKYLCYRQIKTRSGNDENIQPRFGLFRMGTHTLGTTGLHGDADVNGNWRCLLQLSVTTHCASWTLFPSTGMCENTSGAEIPWVNGHFTDFCIVCWLVPIGVAILCQTGSELFWLSATQVLKT